jgi:hypothetical protein
MKNWLNKLHPSSKSALVLLAISLSAGSLLFLVFMTTQATGIAMLGLGFVLLAGALNSIMLLAIVGNWLVGNVNTRESIFVLYSQQVVLGIAILYFITVMPLL